MRLICSLMVVLLIGGAAAPGEAQDVEPNDATTVKRLVISDEAIARALAAERPIIVQQEQRDSLANGAIIGAIIGGGAMAVFTTYLCNALKEPGDPPCWRGVLTISAVFAGIGAAAGAGIDALVARQTPIPIRPERPWMQANRGVIRVRF